MIQQIMQRFILSHRLLSKILDSYTDLIIYFFNGGLIGLCLYLFLLASSQEIILTYSNLQELFGNFTILLMVLNFLSLIISYPIPSKKMFIAYILLTIGFLIPYI